MAAAIESGRPEGDRSDPLVVIEKIFGAKTVSAGPSWEARAWAVETLAQHGVDPVGAPVQAVIILYAAEPRLGLKAARFLVKSFAEADSSGPSGPAGSHETPESHER